MYPPGWYDKSGRTQSKPAQAIVKATSLPSTPTQESIRHSCGCGQIHPPTHVYGRRRLLHEHGLAGRRRSLPNSKVSPSRHSDICTPSWRSSRSRQHVASLVASPRLQTGSRPHPWAKIYPSYLAPCSRSGRSRRPTDSCTMEDRKVEVAGHLIIVGRAAQGCESHPPAQLGGGAVTYHCPRTQLHRACWLLGRNSSTSCSEDFSMRCCKNDSHCSRPIWMQRS